MNKYVNGHALPAQLLRMTIAGLWGPSCRATNLGPLTIADKDDLALLDVPRMIQNTQELRAAMARGEGALFALTKGGAPRPGLLDVEKAVMIAATRGQEALALDYSVGEQPRVVVTCDDPKGLRWIEAARSFDELLSVIKLPGV